MTISITIVADTGAEARAKLASLLGSNPAVLTPQAFGAHASDCAVHNGPALEAGSCDCSGETINADPAEAAAAPVRERGKPAAGRARRTKEEIAEDEAADKADAERAAAAADTGAIVADRQISNEPENRTSPEDAATEAQDQADEQAEVEAAGKTTLTHDDVRNALGGYVKAYGIAAAQEDGPKVLSLIFGEGKVKVSDVPDTQEDLAKAIAGVNEMLTKNPYGRAADL